jgi:alkylhydroperoxidase family enzyme
MDNIKTTAPKSWDQTSKVPGLEDQERAILAYADAMTLDVRVSESVFQQLKEFFSEREVVEITAAIGAYNCVSRFLVALDVGEMNDVALEDWKVENHGIA